MEVENMYITLKTCVNGDPSESNLELTSTRLSLKIEEGSKDMIVKNLYVSIDPYQINRMKKYSSSQGTITFATQLVPREKIDAFGVGRVVVSSNPDFKKDDLVKGVLGWEEYSIVQPGSIISKIATTEFPLSYNLGVLGTSGLTAYSGLYEICKPKKGEKVFVSAASGSVGNLVGQFAKLSGCYVVGCAGSKKKVDMLKDKLGFDDAFNYKEEPDLKSALKRYFPEGIDIYFDNVGAEMLDAAVANMNLLGRVAACGVIAEYTDEGKRAAPNMLDVIYKRITIRGFLTYDHHDKHAGFISSISDHLRQGRIHVLEDISYGLENVPSAFAGLFRGDNIGKKIVKLADPREGIL
ncbi:uncharacterized protein A4U43_C01F24590 [Asparagus officinalis]|uniref:Enoyl reductase (ER) domain-containing protein n=1 Tax=Asparagus officinalis TaxID=4686 RepID=A0A5P1FW06_ASPOF|nr:2-alkenal reductase (NADP(+)-dependent)-like [Asparagus officinalis]XP_020251305.1 2-alkenal reductase (NADP(+)-dependent)-like [Asparagus officinalis]ONK81040.1 uncharacterized protein A4U43_C01F24590 [Asparagus officinalis]